MGSSTTTKEYLGDGVYVDVERGMIVLTTENGIAVRRPANAECS